jgi:hypothetical protein
MTVFTTGGENVVTVRVRLYLDGGNLFNRLRETKRKPYPTSADLLRFARELCSVTPDDAGVPIGGDLVDVLYCNAPVILAPGETNKLQAFMYNLRLDTANFRVRQGTRKLAPNRCPHDACRQDILKCPYCGNVITKRMIEKGVDLQITAECVADAALNEFDIALLFTHDEDYAELSRILHERLGKELKVAYLKPPGRYAPQALIRKTPSGQGIAIDRTPCFDVVFPSRP